VFKHISKYSSVQWKQWTGCLPSWVSLCVWICSQVCELV